MLAQIASFGNIRPEMRKEADRHRFQEQKSSVLKVQSVVCSQDFE